MKLVKKMIRIAIIDDEVTRLTDNVIIHTQYEYKKGKIVPVKVTNKIKFNHGSVCAALIAKQPTEFYSIKIIDDCNATNINKLKIAIEFAVLLDIQIIHISLGSFFWFDGYTLSETVRAAVSKGIIIVASISEDGRRTFPGSFSNVIGVCFSKINGSSFVSCHPNIYNINVFADLKEDLLETNIGLFLLPKKSSYATALVTSELCNWISNTNLLQATINDFYFYLDSDFGYNSDKSKNVEKSLLRKISIQQSIRYSSIVNKENLILKVDNRDSAINMSRRLHSSVVFSHDILKNSSLGVDNIISELEPKTIAKLYCSEQLIEWV